MHAGGKKKYEKARRQEMKMKQEVKKKKKKKVNVIRGKHGTKKLQMERQ